jgi:hypothetical protein
MNESICWLAASSRVHGIMARVQKMDDKKTKNKINIIFARKLDKQYLYNCYVFLPTVVPRSDFINGDFPSDYLQNRIGRNYCHINKYRAGWLLYAQFGFFVLKMVVTFQHFEDIEIAREAKSDLIFLERTRRGPSRASLRPRFSNELIESSPNKELSVSKLRIMATEPKSPSESHSRVGKADISSLKVRSNIAEDSVTSKLVDLAFRTFISWDCFKALVAGHERNIR